MTNFKFSHRATGLPGGNPETDRVGRRSTQGAKFFWA
jgi:hypothetical protein